MSTIDIDVLRDSKGETFTLGKMYVNKVFFGYTCEDKDRFVETVGGSAKVPKETAIPRGTYPVVATYSNRFKRVLPELLDVPFFSKIRIHGGNSIADTEGCILLGAEPLPTGVHDCKDVVERLTKIIESAGRKGSSIFITIR